LSTYDVLTMFIHYRTKTFRNFYQKMNEIITSPLTLSFQFQLFGPR